MGGGDKTLLRLGGRPLLAHVIDRLRPQVKGLALSANGDPGRVAGFGIPVIADSVADAGPLANARLLEPLGLLWIHLAIRQGHGTGIAFRLARR